ncbi:response regulator [Hymenobacter busanensis]|uniref:Response regulator n=1 Tax=Hymenobacter busanensis TaxID=2607656 RepID=A0A7L4ZZH8_9BACT|nr:response regulator [Hymenobacter busanensis]KAA9332119.1 response regulator [Hymenobacter busanensis]QHJ07542.1 response regulator [Hymenobacter busanensis]
MNRKLQKVVLIDDNETTSFLNNRLLQRLELADNVLSFTNAEQAFAHFWGKQGATPDEAPELVFVDLKMPGMDGFEFLNQYNRLAPEQRQKTVMAVLTTSMHSADTTRVAQYEGVEYLAKPLTEEKMQRLLQKRFAMAS